MGTLTVMLAGEPKFTWTGVEADIAELEAVLQQQTTDLTALARQSFDLVTFSHIPGDEMKEKVIAAAAYFVLQMPALARSGLLRDHIAAFDIVVDISADHETGNYNIDVVSREPGRPAASPERRTKQDA